MQPFGRQHLNWSHTLLRSARNQFPTTLPLILDRGSRKRFVLVRSELLGQFVNTLTAGYMYYRYNRENSSQKSSNADMPKTENSFPIFYWVSEIYVKFGVF